MFLGLSTFGFVHTVLSLLALACGLVVVTRLLAAKWQDGWAALYFASAVAADATGFAFPGDFGIPHYLGIVAALALLLAIPARYAFSLAGVWRPIYAVSTVVSVYILVFFTIGEAFIRIPALNALAPSQTELPFALVQLAGLLLFGWIAVAAGTRFREKAVERLG
jgi:hypothetical protein